MADEHEAQDDITRLMLVVSALLAASMVFAYFYAF